MTDWLRAGRIALVFCLANLGTLFHSILHWPLRVVLPLGGVLFIAYLILLIRPRRAKGATRRLRALLGGYELLLVGFGSVIATTIYYLILYLSGWLTQPYLDGQMWQYSTGAILFVPVLWLVMISGFVRVLLTCHHLRIIWRILLLFFWWVPIFHIYLYHRVLRAARYEYHFELHRLEQEAVHAENKDCATKYPIVLVHGIFFRDWQHLNYWGRIPRSLQACGATLYYGGQQSSAPVAKSAQEVKARVMAVLEETGAEKVNIIAHSKGGLDSRYAISQLGLAPYVASLTTVNTPHRGCIFAQHLLDTLPQWMKDFVERKYNAIFHTLGDEAPDFMGGVQDLASGACAAFNETNPDAEGVYYQSIMSTMSSPRSAAFPLNFTWRLVKKYDKEPNDGLVSLSSAQWGTYLGEYTTKGKRGVSHGDVIDLMREDIPGYPVRQVYIDLVKGLREKGF